MMMPTFPFIALVRRELLVTLRKKRTIFLLALIVGITVYSVSKVLYPYSKLISNSSISNLDIAELSRQLLDLVFGMALLGGLVIIPGLSGSAIVNERQQDTYDLLHGSLLGPRGIVLGKLANCLGFYMLLLIGMFPVLGATFFLVGIDWVELLCRLLVLFTTLLLFAAVGLWCSTFFRRPVVAIMCSYAFVFCFCIFEKTIAINLCDILDHWFPMYNLSWLYDAFSPILLISSLAFKLIDSPTYILNGYGTTGAWIQNISASLNMSMFSYSCLLSATFSILLSYLLILWTFKILNRPQKTKVPKQETIIVDEALLETRRKQFPYYLLDPCKRRSLIPDYWNPMLAKEFRYSLLGKSTKMIRLFVCIAPVYMCILLVYGLTSGVEMSSTNSRISAILPQIWISIFLIPILMGGIFTKEHEQGNLDMLRMTTLRTGKIIIGKAGGAMMSLLPILGTSFLYALLTPLLCWYYNEQYNLQYHLAGLATFAVSVMTALCLCLFISSWCKSTVAGVLIALIAIGIVFVVIPVAYVYWPSYIRPNINLFGQYRFTLSDWSWSPVFSYKEAFESRYRTEIDLSTWLTSIELFSYLSALFFFMTYLNIYRLFRRGRT